MIEIGCIESGTVLGHTPDVKNLLADLGIPADLPAVGAARVREGLQLGTDEATAEGKGRIFDMAAGTAIDYSRAQDTGGASLILVLKHTIFDKLVYGKLRGCARREGRICGSGGAPLGERLGHFFRGIGVTILEGTA